MEDYKPLNTPMLTRCTLSKYDDSKEEDQRWYISTIGNLLYVTTSRPDIMEVVGMVARFQTTLKETHVQAIKIFFLYLKGTLDFGLWYPTDDTFITTYSDVYWERCVDDRKSTNVCALFLGDCLVSWLNKEQYSISLTTIDTNI